MLSMENQCGGGPRRTEISTSFVILKFHDMRFGTAMRRPSMDSEIAYKTKIIRKRLVHCATVWRREVLCYFSSTGLSSLLTVFRWPALTAYAPQLTLSSPPRLRSTVKPILATRVRSV